jgi:hypothetical protein
LAELIPFADVMQELHELHELRELDRAEHEFEQKKAEIMKRYHNK